MAMTAVLERERLHAVLAGVVPGSAVVLCGPMGMGKTSLLRGFAERNVSSVLVDGASIRSAHHLRELFASFSHADWLLIDDVDLANGEAIAELVRTIATGARSSIRIIIAGRSRSVLGLGAIAASGRAIVLGTEDLSFTIEEAARLADAAGVSYGPEDLAELVHITDGWPVALAWIVRDSAERQPLLRGAFERWAERNAHLMLEYVATDNCHDVEIRRRFMATLSQERRSSDAVFAELESVGCPVARSRTGLRSFRLLNRLMIASAETPSASALFDPLFITLFGRFQCRIGSRDMVFARRRDQNLLIYLALAPGGRATRTELQGAFWPDVPTAVASQGLRITLSRLRRSIAALAPNDVDRYLMCNGAVTLDLRHVHVDARRFSEHMEYGLIDEKSGEMQSCNRHFQAAERIYAGSLLASEPIEHILAPRVAEYGRMFELLLSRLSQRSAGTSRPASLGGFDPTHDYERIASLERMSFMRRSSA